MLIKKSGFTSIEDLFLSIVGDLIESGFLLRKGTNPKVYKETPTATPIWTLESGPAVDPLSDSQPWRIRFDATDVAKYGWQVVQDGVTDFSLGTNKITPFRKYMFQRRGRVIVGTKTNLSDLGDFASYSTFDDSKVVSTAVDKLQTYFKGSYDDSLATYMESITGGADSGTKNAAGSSRPVGNDYLTPYAPNARVNKDLFIDWIDANQDEYGEELDSDLSLTGRVNLDNVKKDTLLFDNTSTILINGATKYLREGDTVEFFPSGVTSSLCSGVVTELLVAEGFLENGTAKAYVKLSGIKGTFRSGDTVKRSIINEQGTIAYDVMDNYTGTRFIPAETIVRGTNGTSFYKATADHIEDTEFTPETGLNWATNFSAYTLKPGEVEDINDYGVKTKTPLRYINRGDLVRGNEPPKVVIVTPADPTTVPPTPAVTSTNYSHWICTTSHWEDYKFSPGTGDQVSSVFEKNPSPVIDVTTGLVDGEIINYVKVPVWNRKFREIQPGTLVIGSDEKVYECILAHVEDKDNYPGFGPNFATYFTVADRKVKVGTISSVVTPIIYDTLAQQDWSQHWIGVAVRDNASTMGETALYTGVKWDAGKKELSVYPQIDASYWGDSSSAGVAKDLEVRIIRSNLKFGYTNFNVVPGDLGHVLSDSEINDGRPVSYVMSITDRGFALAMTTEAMSFIESSDLGVDEAFLKFGRNSETILKDRGPFANNIAFGYTGYSWIAIQRLCNAKTDEVLVKGDSPVICWYMIPSYTKYIAELIQIIDPAYSISVKIKEGNDSLFDPIPTSSTYSPIGLLDRQDAKVYLGDDNGMFTGDTIAYGSIKVKFIYESGSKLPDNKTWDWSSGDIVGVATISRLVGTWENSLDPENMPYYLYSEAGDKLGTLVDLTKPKSFKYLESCKVGAQRNIRQIVVRESDITSPSAPVDVDKFSDYVNCAVNHRKQISISNKDEYILNIPDGINTRRNLYHNDRLDMIGFISGSVVSEGTYAEVTMNTGSVCEEADIKKRKYLGTRTSVGNNEGSRLMLLSKGGNILPCETIAETTTALPNGSTSYTINTNVLVNLLAYGADKIYYTIGSGNMPEDIPDPVIIDPKDVNTDGVTGTQIFKSTINLSRSSAGKVFIKAMAVDIGGNVEPVKTIPYSFSI